MKIVFKMNAKTITAPILDFFLVFPLLQKSLFTYNFLVFRLGVHRSTKNQKKRAVKVLAFVFLKSKIAT